MKDGYHPPQPLFTSEQIRKALSAADAGYGKNFSDKEWEEIAERMERLTRLIWKISQRQGKYSDPERNPPKEKTGVPEDSESE